jgi:glycosyltransferase involved in cell wall biosynthesis
MRILHVSSWFQPQLGYSEYNLPCAQKRLGHTVAILTSDRYFPFPDYESTVQAVLGNRIVGGGIKEEYGLQTFRLSVRLEYRHQVWLRGFEGAMAQFRPDIVHIHEAFTLPVLQSALLKSRHRYGLVVASSMEKEVFYPQSLVRRVYYGAYRLLIAPILRRQVDIFAAVGIGAQEILAHVFTLPLERIELVPLGADSERFSFDRSARINVRAELGLQEDVTLFVYAGKLIPDKDVHVLLEAFTLAKPSSPIALLLLGNGSPEYADRLHACAQVNSKPVFFRSAVQNDLLPCYLSAADVGVWPSQSSNAAVEAALIGLPLIVSESVAAKHYIQAGNGLSFPRGDVRALANCIERLADTPDLRHQMALQGRTYIEQQMSWHAIARRYSELYGSIRIDC